MGKEEFLKKARELGLSETSIKEIVKDVEEDIALGLPVDWEMYLIPPVISD